LIREAESFHVIAYGATAAALPEVIEMATDGAEYTDMSPGRGGAFPLIRLAVDEGRDFSEIEGAVLLTHLAVFADEVERCTRLLNSFAALRERHRGEVLGEAALLSRWVSQLEPADLGDGVILVRDLIRSGPFGFFRSVGLNRDTTVEGIQAVLDKYQRELEFEHFESYLVDRRAKELDAAVAVLRDLCGRIVGGEPIGRFQGEVDSFLKRGISPGSLEQFELDSVGGVSSSTDREVLLRMMVESPEPFMALRREMVGALGVTASNILRDWFQVEPQGLDVPVFDDLTWLVVGPRQAVEPAKDET
jgi:hypothetical protein